MYLSSFFLLSSFLTRTKKADVARVEKRTFICSHTRNGAKPTPKEGIKSKLGHWKDPDEMDAILAKDFDGCMKGQFATRLSCVQCPVQPILSVFAFNVCFCFAFNSSCYP